MNSCIFIGIGLVGLAATSAVLSSPIVTTGVLAPIGVTAASQARLQLSTVAAELLPEVIAAGLAKATPTQREMLLNMVAQTKAGDMGPAICFTPDTPNEVVSAFNAMLGFEQAGRFILGGRWNFTATDGSAGGQGDPITLTYSFVPDGTQIFGFAGEPSAPSDMFAYFNGIYGSPAVWQAVFAQVFARWGELSGVTYVFEPNDDGASQADFQGQIGVRGDVRISGHPIDGGSGILAYNFFPDTADMVLDTSDNFFNNIGGGSLGLRNVVSHEHGHGLGMEHVCPITQTKLLEPFVSTAYDGPRHDDIRNAQRNYGDIFEPDNFAAQANTVLGTIAVGTAVDIGTPTPPSAPLGSILSLDADGEQDYFAMTVTESATVTATVTPLGETYDDSIQSQACQDPGNCCSGSFTDSLTVADLQIEVIDTDGVSILATAANAPIGLPDQVVNVALPSAGTYFIRVFEANAPSQSQLYTLNVSVSAGVIAVCQGDSNGDGVVNFADITDVLGNWLTNGSNGGDANADGTVNFADITSVLGNWLVVCP